MTTTLTLKIPGKPISKARPRFFRKDNYVGTYNTQKTEESRFLFEVQKQLEGHRPIEGPIRISINFSMLRPKSHYGTGKNFGKRKPSAPNFPAKKPDIDNLFKFVLDCLNGIAWKDDRQIVDAFIAERYSDLPGTKIIVQELPE